MNKKEVIQTLETIAVYLEIKGENAFRVSAYRKAAGALEKDERSLEEIEDPASISGIGKGTAGIINDLRETGTTELLEQLQQEVPGGLVPLLKLPGLGGKKIGKLYQELGITSAEELKKACEANDVQGLAGFGKKTEEKILEAVNAMGQRPERLPIVQVYPAVEALGERLDKMTAVLRWELAGSFRRGRETVKDLDFIISTENPGAVKDAILALPEIDAVIGKGEAKISVEFQFGDVIIPADFRIVEDRSFASTLHHFTGSKDHNVLMRQRAKERGEKVSEYGVEKEETGERIYFKSEEEFYAHFGLSFIPPEVREGRHELERNFDNLVQLSDIKGDLHMHTTWSDGAQSIEEMADRCIEKGYEFMAVTDHSQYLKVANGLTVERLRRQHEEVRRIEKDKNIRIFTGVEMDILPDGTLDYEDDVLKEIDFVIASIHSSFQQDEETIMMRLENACRNPYVNMIAHPTGRLIGRRDGYKVDMDRLIRTAAETGTVLELNANPNRLDLAAEPLAKAKAAGVKVAVNTDAHRFDMLEDMEAGVKTARRAALEGKDVLNTWTTAELEKFFNKQQQ
ncbi:DNA polymerase/3'-5' exonuclease PolX [Alkalicoccus saliphilus]|uniref:DNA polymerase beta n=1 Tax=Alkalicoccus saliphilus TaxID=200989 RepID=A0A2T4U921_9BACI|nr:DNA polymerase/3'-5' exonuclease PolX [Alkalicoccus saliphilus]PTL39896.1 DNA polymerase/3'-5' exonuclease PolX [Alkalicoccus saliphilus]